MAKFLIQATYSAEGIKGVVKEKASARKAAFEKALSGAGAKLEAMYLAFGEYDTVSIVDAPDNATLMAVDLSVCSTGLVRTRTTPLLTVEEADQAIKKGAKFRGPGQ